MDRSAGGFAMATFCIVSPSRWAHPDDIKTGADIIRARGHRVIVHPQNGLSDGGRLAGSDQARANALMDAFRNNEVDIVLAARGGTGALRILKLLDWGLIRQHRKKFCGFSDITALLHALHQHGGIETFHGPVATSLARNEQARNDFFEVLAGTKTTWTAPGGKVARAGDATGRLVGGNLTLLQSLLGTEYDWTSDDAILFIEESNEALYRIDRMLAHLKLAGKLESVRGFIFGESDIPDGRNAEPRQGDSPFGRSLAEILREWLPGSIPIVTNFPCGHESYNTTLPVGVTARLSAQNGAIKLSKV